MSGEQLILSSASLLSKWGFDDGNPFDEVADWWHDRHGEPLMGHCDCGYADLGVDRAELLEALIRRYLLPALDQRVEVEMIGTSHNPVRARSIDGVPVPDAVIYGAAPDPVLTPDAVEIPYVEVVKIADQLRGGV